MIRRRTSPRGRRRPGKTMIEMMVVIATSSLLISLAGGLFHHLSRTERAFRDSAAAGRAQARLVRAFRNDARQAQSAQVGWAVPTKANDQPARPVHQTENPKIEFKIGENIITYLPTEHGLRRESQMKTVGQREDYYLGDIEATFSIDDDLAMLLVKPRRVTPPAKPRSVGAFRLVAAIGADRINRARSSPAAPVVAPRPTEATP